MGVLDNFNVGAQVADTVTGIVSGIAHTLQDVGVIALNEEQKAKITAQVNDQILKHNDQLIGAYKAEIDDLKSARDMQINVLKDAPHWVKALAAVVIPYGGIMALSVFFFNIMAPWVSALTLWGYHFDIPRVTLSDHESYTLDGIIVFFFGYRFTSKLTGIAGKY